MRTTTRTIRVFIRSTFGDLKAERSALQDRVFPPGRMMGTGPTASM